MVLDSPVLPSSSSFTSVPSSSPSPTVSTISPSSSLSHAHHFISLKLTSTNYLFWKTQLVPFLHGQNLLGYVDGTFSCPTPIIMAEGTTAPQPNPAHANWIQQDQLILSLLVSSLSEEILPLAVGLSTSKQVWDALATSLSSSSNTRILNLHMSLQNLKQADLSVSHYLQKAKLLIDELSAAGRPICLSDQNIYIFRPPS